jgi:hypothetical protein
MTTPEGKVKKEIKRVLKAFNVHYDMPVNYGYGKKGVDFHCCVRAYPMGAVTFYIEAKEDGKEPTALQEAFLRDRREQQGAKTFVIDGHEGITQLTEWLESIESFNNDYARIPARAR